MIYKVESSKVVLNYVISKFRPMNSNWYVDAIEWIGDALGIIGCSQQYCDKPFRVTIKEFKGKIPCGVESIRGIEYNGFRLTRNGGINNKETCVAHLPVSSKESYTLNPNYIHTSFEEGEIIIYGKAIPTCSEGYPLVPDNPFYREALGWYIMMNLCLRGIKHPIINFEMAEARWKDSYPRAQNSGAFPDIDNYEIFKNRWNNIIEDINAAPHFFNSLINPDAGVKTITIENIEDISNGI